MAERKVKCVRCGKWFKAADYRHTLCPSCTAAERLKKAATPAAPRRLTPAPPTIRQPSPAETPPTEPATAPVPLSAVAAPSEARTERAEPVAPKGDSAAPPRRQTELTIEQRQAVEARYLELAEPREYDGIRGQIAGELKLSKTLVKRAVNDLRQRLGRPSWWEAQRAAIPDDVLQRVKARYLALLAEQPLPPIGLHRQLAEELDLPSLQVYRAIGQIRADLGLPKFNERPEEMSETTEAQAAQAS